MKIRFRILAYREKDGDQETVHQGQRMHLEEAKKSMEYAFLEGADVCIVTKVKYPQSQD